MVIKFNDEFYCFFSLSSLRYWWGYFIHDGRVYMRVRLHLCSVLYNYPFSCRVVYWNYLQAIEICLSFSRRFYVIFSHHFFSLQIILGCSFMHVSVSKKDFLSLPSVHPPPPPSSFAFCLNINV